jgi:hypothetical protein
MRQPQNGFWQTVLKVVLAALTVVAVSILVQAVRELF